MRVVLRALEREQAGQKRELIERVEEITREEFPDVPAEQRPVEATGLYVLLTFLIESLLRDQVVSFVLAAIGITVMMALAFRNPWIGLVGLVPNLFPIVLVIGAMGWMGLPVNIATAMIASVSLGLTVDSSIHYISGFRRARAAGKRRGDGARADTRGRRSGRGAGQPRAGCRLQRTDALSFHPAGLFRDPGQRGDARWPRRQPGAAAGAAGVGRGPGR
ncbi:MAG: hypothetical protein Ct9H300mP1_00480 [Planctomycetaceae bacterium]|nr:MAG: hypothetical protein Ct9H300mP1_00480 [Planctomycetaceae bacterium]